MASHLETIARTRALLLSRANHDSKVKLFGFDKDLVAIAVAFEALSAQYTELVVELVKMRLRLGELSPEMVEHKESCECRLCCLARMVAHGRKSFTV